MLEEVRHNDELIAIIVRSDFDERGTSFVTPNSSSLQLAYMRHPEGKRIAAHRHNAVARTITDTCEVLVIKKGKLRVDFYTKEAAYLNSRLLGAGDTILLTANGAHGFEVLESLEMLEIKQGPYIGEVEKSRFDWPVDFTPRIIE